MKKFLLPLFAAIALLAGCATTQTTQSGAVGVERKQFMMLSEKQVDQMAAQSYLQTLKEAETKKTLNSNPQQTERVRAIANRLIAQTGVFRPDAANWKWEVNVQESKDVNAYCMPGGKIMVYTGLIDKLNPTDDELANVMGHEISHALREHGRERMSRAYAQQIGLVGLAVALGATSKDRNAAANTMMIGSTVTALALTLPNSREAEREADRMGLELSARAGYDPNAAITLWQKMGAQGGSKPPEWLSTHPSEESRMKELQSLIPTVMPLYQEARAKKT
ncbi:MAG TPA: M48 family metallopeptidase [Methylophilaceae bacterium]|nr:M48 family metallopeptidase [Methylophilaceae bacterium]HQR61096.1 M48 family metallopeptidase [Methylophilaceae bacterium]